MVPLQHLSRQATVWLSLLICYAPFGWVFFIGENRLAWIKLWLILPGMMVSMVLRYTSSQSRIYMPQSLMMPFAIAISLAIVGTVLWLMFRFPRRRILIAGFTLVISVLLSICAYAAYLA